MGFEPGIDGVPHTSTLSPTPVQQVLELEPGNDWAQRTVSRIEPIVLERHEKLKGEMFGKLKVGVTDVWWLGVTGIAVCYLAYPRAAERTSG